MIGKIHANALDIVRLDASLDLAHAAPRQATAWCDAAPAVLEVLLQCLCAPVLATPSSSPADGLDPHLLLVVVRQPTVAPHQHMVQRALVPRRWSCYWIPRLRCHERVPHGSWRMTPNSASRCRHRNDHQLHYEHHDRHQLIVISIMHASVSGRVFPPQGNETSTTHRLQGNVCTTSRHTVECANHDCHQMRLNIGYCMHTMWTLCP
mmetsp:Transcript_15025/g.52746  ORF Transcript_15025/g.52746 Transcript_15025/m.52746 type:complete len:207 (-) Transcript_15025:3-623(-)